MLTRCDASTPPSLLLLQRDERETRMTEQVDTYTVLQNAVQAHVAAQTGGDLVTDFVLVAGIVDHATGERTSWLTTSRVARWQVRGLLSEGIVAIDSVDA